MNKSEKITISIENEYHEGFNSHAAALKFAKNVEKMKLNIKIYCSFDTFYSVKQYQKYTKNEYKDKMSKFLLFLDNFFDNPE